MKLVLFLVLFAGFFKVNSFPRFSKESALQKAFLNISRFLAEQNRLISVVVSDGLSDEQESVVFPLNAAVPHVVATFGNDSKVFRLNSSAIVLLDSVETLKAFNQRTVLPSYVTTT